MKYLTYVSLNLDSPSSVHIIWQPIASQNCTWVNKGRRQWHPTPVLFCLENPMDGGAWQASVHGVAKSPTGLSDFTSTFHFCALEKEMATHSSVLAWRIPGTAEPGGLLSLGSHRVRHDWSDLAAAAANKGMTVFLSVCTLGGKIIYPRSFFNFFYLLRYF